MLDASELLHSSLASITSNTLLIMISQSANYEIVGSLQGSGSRVSPTSWDPLRRPAERSARSGGHRFAVSQCSETSMGAFKTYTGSLVLLLAAVRTVLDPNLEPE
jgi:hypothetical protein